jgi:hypothetical protein
MGGAQSGGGEIPVERSGFLNISTKPISFFFHPDGVFNDEPSNSV